MAGIVTKKIKTDITPAVLIKHYDEVPEVLPDGNFKPKFKFCDKEITGSTKVTTNWWTHLVQRVPPSSAPVEKLFSIAGKGC